MHTISVQDVLSRIEAQKNELFSLLSDLIRINSENAGSWGNEEEIAGYIGGLCREMDLETEVYSPLELPGFTDHPDYLPGRNLQNRPNVTAVWRGASDENRLMLMGHTDTVLIGDRSAWSFEPLSGEIIDGTIRGRGACDDKYALATALFLIRLLKDMGFEPQANLLFTAYSDEERGGSHGALAASLRYPCERIVNMDCKNFEIWHSASGGGELIYRYHTAEPVDSAAKTASVFPIVMEELRAFADRRRAELSDNRFYRGTIIPETSLRYMDIHAGNIGADLGVGELLFVYYTDRTREEIGEELAALEKTIADRLAPLGVIGDGFRPNTRFFHYAFSEPDCDSIRDMQAAALQASGRTLQPCGSCLSDLSVILKYGSRQAYGFGIGRDFDEYGGAHQPDEFIECDKLLEYAKIIAVYILNVMSRP